MLRMNAAARTLVVALAALVWARGASAQDPLVLLPQAYKLVFENDWVKVVRVHYAPHEKLPMHDHTEHAAAFVYLNDCGPVTFKHDWGELTRPATTTGSFRLYDAAQEIHEVDNPNDEPSDFLRVELKTRPISVLTFKGRFHRETNPDGQDPRRVQFDHPQLRVSRYLMAPGLKADFSSPVEPSLVIALTRGTLKADGGPAAGEIVLEPGLVRWLPKAAATTFENVGASAVEILRFDLKTEPLAVH
jgi:hypothetical protein